MMSGQRTDVTTVTVGLPVHNGDAYLAAALDSLLAQRYAAMRVLVFDNASTDRTREICADYAARDDRVTVHRNPRNIGAAANFNIAAQRCKTPLFMWANHDDQWDPEYIPRCVAALEAEPEAVLAYTRSEKIDDRGQPIAELMADLGLDDPAAHRRLRAFHDWFRQCDEHGLWSTSRIEGLWIPVYGIMRASALSATGLIGPYISSDTILLEELLLHGRFVEVPSTLFGKRDHAGRSMRDSRAYERRLAWFTGRTPGRFLFPKWRMLRGRLAAVARAPLPSGERASCLVEMLGFYVRRPHEGKSLVKEALINLARSVRIRADRPGPLERRLPQVW